MRNIQALDVHVLKTVLNGQMYELLTYDEYISNRGSLSHTIAVKDNYKGKDIILPYKGKYTGNPIIPGIYNGGCVDFVIYPNDNEIDQYVPGKIIEFNNKDDIKQTLEKSEIIERLKEPWITSPDNITTIPILEEDQPEMVCLKRAINEKEIDLDKYAPRFGENFPNDKRQLKNKSATLNIIKRFCEKLDMEALLILKDKNSNVPNPMNTEIIVSLTDSYTESD